MVSSESPPTELPPGFAARPLCPADIAAAVRLSAEAGWNQVAADWRVFLEHGSAIAVTTSDGNLVATAAMLPHGDHIAWISMVLVTARYRRLGLATWLLRRCIATLLAKGLVPVLDATQAGHALYLGLGFTDSWGLSRMVVRQTTDVGVVAAPHGITVRPLRSADWPKIVAYDAAIFGADRERLLHHLAGRLPAAALVAESEGQIAGFLLGRDGRVMNQLGPLVAESEPIARALLDGALAGVRAPVVIDIADRHAGIGTWLTSMSFSAERSFMRMTHGPRAIFGDSNRLVAIAGPELG